MKQLFNELDPKERMIACESSHTKLTPVRQLFVKNSYTEFR